MAKKKVQATKSLFSQKHQTRNRLLLYISAFSIGLPLLFVNLYIQNQNANVLGASTSVQGENQRSSTPSRLTCQTCQQSLHHAAIIALQENSSNSKDWGAVCLPKEVLNSNTFKSVAYISCPTPTPRPTGRPSGEPTHAPRPSWTPRPSEHPSPSMTPGQQ